MYCQNCGKQIPDGVAFCNYCGARQIAVEPVSTADAHPRSDASQPAQKYQYQTPQPTQAAPPSPSSQKQQKPKKKSGGLLTTVIVIIAFWLLGRFAGGRMADSMLSSKSSDSRDTSSYTLPTLAPVWTLTPRETIDIGGGSTGAGSTETNPAYTALFSGTRVVHAGIVMGPNIEGWSSFAMDNGEDAIICQDYGYRGDQVLKYIETAYFYNVDQYTEDYPKSLTESAEQEIAKYSGIECAEVTYEYWEGLGLFKVKYVFSDLDQQDNCRALYDIGLFEEPGGLSMSRCEQQALAGGFVKR